MAAVPLVTITWLSHCCLPFHNNASPLLEYATSTCILTRCLYTHLILGWRTHLHYINHLEILIDHCPSCQSPFSSFQQSSAMLIKCTFDHDIASDFIQMPSETEFADAHFQLLWHHSARNSWFIFVAMVAKEIISLRVILFIKISLSEVQTHQSPLFCFRLCKPLKQYDNKRNRSCLNGLIDLFVMRSHCKTTRYSPRLLFDNHLNFSLNKLNYHTLYYRTFSLTLFHSAPQFCLIIVSVITIVRTLSS